MPMMICKPLTPEIVARAQFHDGKLFKMATDRENGGIIFSLSGAQIIGAVSTFTLLVPAIFWAATLWNRSIESERQISAIQVQIKDMNRLEVEISRMSTKLDSLSKQIEQRN